MELSQSALAMLLIGGIPAGIALNLVYACSDFSTLPDSYFKRLVANTKDFLFMILAGMTAILIVYFINAGQYRNMVLVGMLAGYVVSHFTFARCLIAVRNALLRYMTIPIVWIWRKTFGVLCAKVRMKAMNNATSIRIKELMLRASQGFEN